MKNILFLADYQPHAPYILQYALSIAKHYQATIHFVHIFPMLSTGGLVDNMHGTDSEPFVLAGQYEQQYEAAAEKLRQFASNYMPQSASYELGTCTVKTGDKSKEILDTIEEQTIDLVVMGMNQSSKTNNLFFGNLSLELIEKAPCPILLIPKTAVYWGINNIMYASDHEQPSIPSIQLLIEWTRVFEADLHLIHILRPLMNSDSIPYLESLIAAFQEEIDKERLQVRIVKGDVKEEIMSYAALSKADLIALTKHDRKFWNYLLTPHLFGKQKEITVPVLVFKRV